MVPHFEPTFEHSQTPTIRGPLRLTTDSQLTNDYPINVLTLMNPPPFNPPEHLALGLGSILSITIANLPQFDGCTLPPFPRFTPLFSSYFIRYSPH